MASQRAQSARLNAANASTTRRSRALLNTRRNTARRSISERTYHAGCGARTSRLGPTRTTEGGMELGNFSVSLAVKDLDASRQFYETLGFTTMGGDASQGWLILTSGPAIIGLFQGMFERNILTFNPGWDAAAQPLASFTDVRDIQRRL